MGGLTFEEGKRALQPVVDDFLPAGGIYRKKYRNPLPASPFRAGRLMDAEAALAHAMKNGGEEKRISRWS